jgi:CHAT domain-containing protein
MNVKLVTLTNCSSGAGSVIRGEGINSLARAFLAAGAECVVASLWPIRSNFAHLFMINFYKALKTQSIQHAFYETQKYFCQNHPEFNESAIWAPMFIMGNSNQFIKELK